MKGKNGHYPMNRIQDQVFRRCNARNRQGNQCGAPAIRGKSKCRLHGGKSKTGAEHGRFKHGYYTREQKERRRIMRALLRSCEVMLGEE